MKLSVSAYRAHASAHKKILSSSYQTQFNYGTTTASSLAGAAAPHQPAPGLFNVSFNHDYTSNQALNIPAPKCDNILWC